MKRPAKDDPNSILNQDLPNVPEDANAIPSRTDRLDSGSNYLINAY